MGRWSQSRGGLVDWRRLVGKGVAHGNLEQAGKIHNLLRQGEERKRPFLNGRRRSNLNFLLGSGFILHSNVILHILLGHSVLPLWNGRTCKVALLGSKALPLRNDRLFKHLQVLCHIRESLLKATACHAGCLLGKWVHLKQRKLTEFWEGLDLCLFGVPMEVGQCRMQQWRLAG